MGCSRSARGLGSALPFSLHAVLEGKELLPYIWACTRQVMSTLTVTAKGQVTLRKELLKHLGVQPGQQIAVNKLPDGRIEMKAAWPTGKISDVFDLFKNRKRRALSIEEINELARRGWAGRR
jgi:bifunctional DNA-binding transcriptional regulator/antitoxin component of YhaV-PrlF toxin-antitoxin module